eukprot:TRINITY_DN5178_c0_g2_i1.p1 TRINITY_DN5178_c0_g2~~TRINITY_DN5178_c0_g2_i1.p1  ORF type:complete len:557 (-),score=62.46 TRINITY_DN5178_c0_g2_i1:71-1741(-)
MIRVPGRPCRITATLAASRRGAGVLFAASAVFLQGSPVVAEVFDLKTVQPPGPLTLKALHFFYVYNSSDTPKGSSGTTSGSLPWISFSKINYTSSDRDALAQTDGLQLTLMRYDDFWSIPFNFCCLEEDVSSGRCSKPNRIRIHSDKLDHADNQNIYKMDIGPKPKTRKYHINMTSAYVLLISNCGMKDLKALSIRGRVAVKNPFGFLPGADFYKLHFFVFLSALYILLTFIWGILSVVHRHTLFSIQIAIGIVMLFSLFESLVWLTFYLATNVGGTPSLVIYAIGVLASVIKSIFSYMLVLVGAMGWGVTKPTLSNGEVLRIGILTVTFIALDAPRRMVISFRQSYEVHIGFVLGILVPVAILNGGIFYCVFTQLGNMLRLLEETKQTHKLKVFRRLGKVLVFALIVATISQLLEFVTISRSIEDSWKSDWIYSDGVSHGLFACVLIAMMVLWKPTKNSQRYAYSAQIDDIDTDRHETTVPGMESVVSGRSIELKEEEDDEDFWGLQPKKLDGGDAGGASGGDRSGDGERGDREGRSAASSSGVNPSTVGAMTSF